MTIRQMRAEPTRMNDAVVFATFVAGRLNENHGAAMGVSVNIGGDPTAVSLSGRWETLGDYEKMRHSMMADEQLQSAIRMGTSLFVDAQDVIGQVLRPAGDPGGIATVSRARMQMENVAEAIPFALEVADVVHGITGNDVGVVTAVTGDRSELMWLGFNDSLAAVGEQNEALEANPDYVGLFKRSAATFVPGSLTQSFWQIVG